MYVIVVAGMVSLTTYYSLRELGPYILRDTPKPRQLKASRR